MAVTTSIEWTTSTFNAWIGCTNISRGCDHCYAEQMNAYRGWTEWGPHGQRRRTSAANWKKPIQWNEAAPHYESQHGHRHRVFCSSLADVFDNQAPQPWRDDLFALIAATPRLDWQLLTKRPQNIAKMLPKNWSEGYANVWLGTTCEDQMHFNQRWPILRDIPAVVHFVSYEPALGPLRLPAHGPQPHWLISGGESGPGARLCDPPWLRAIRDDCLSRGVAFFHKQFGTYRSNPLVLEAGLSPAQAEARDPRANGKGGAMLDGRLWRGFPSPTRVPLEAT